MREGRSAEAEAGCKEPTEAQKAAAEELVERAYCAPRSRSRIAFPYDVAWARGYAARPFDEGYVFDQGGRLTASGDPLMKIMGAVTGMDAGALAQASDSPEGAPLRDRSQQRAALR